MKKLFIAAILIVLLGIIALPFINGMVMEKAFNEYVTQVNQMYADSGTGFHVDVLQYNRGYMNSEIEWKITPGQLSGFYPVDEITLLDKAKHGLFGVSSITSLANNPWYRDGVIDKVGKDPLTIESSYKFGSDVISKISIEPFSYPAEELEISVLPGQLSFTADPNFKNIHLEGDWEGISIPDSLTKSDFSFSGDMEIITPLIWTGDVSFGVAEITMTNQDQPLTINDLKGDYTVNLDEKTGNLTMAGKYQVDEIAIGEYSLKDLIISGRMAGLNAKAYEEAMQIYMTFVSTLVRNIEQSSSDPASLEKLIEENIMGLGLQLMAVYEKLLNAGLEIAITELSGNLPEGDIKATARLALEEDLSMGQMLPMAVNPNLLFSYLTINSEIRVPASLIGENHVLTTPFHPAMQTGLFVKDEEYLIHKAETRDGILFINDQELKL